jgi:3',5'-cyclic AMP phosphodiesterase CpdA
LSIRLVHLSDIHFGAENKEATEAAIVAARAYSPHVVIVTGDVTSGGRKREFKAARVWLSRLPTPRIVTPGNHDTPYWNLLLRTLVPFERYRRYIATLSEPKIDLPHVVVRAITTARGAQPRLNWAQGAANLEAIRRASREMNRTETALKVLICHHPLVETHNVAVSGGVHRGETAAYMLAEAGIDLILTGHVHNPFAIVLPHGDGLTYAIGAGTLSLRTRGTPESFSMIEAHATTITVSVLGWSGCRFEPFLSWTFKRRERGQPGIASKRMHEE